MIHLDTSFLIRVLETGSPENQKLRTWVREGEEFSMSTIAWTEFQCGPLDRSDIESAAAIIDDYRQLTSEHASLAARLFNQSGRRRGSLTDCMIAATAIADGAPLATADAGDFRRLQDSGLSLA